MVHVPTAASVTVVPDTVQTAVVCELKLTVSPELAIAPTRTGEPPNAAVRGYPWNVIVWLACVTARLWLTGVAAA
jgi:hypothetical protein